MNDDGVPPTAVSNLICMDTIDFLACSKEPDWDTLVPSAL